MEEGSNYPLNLYPSEKMEALSHTWVRGKMIDGRWKMEETTIPPLSTNSWKILSILVMIELDGRWMLIAIPGSEGRGNSLAAPGSEGRWKR
jgi:hypothetical protein